MPKNLSKIKVTVITGFLGAGKTTFINNLLKKYPDKRFALVENELGDVSIDSMLIKGIDASSMFELKNGCICCTISNEYELVLQELAERFPETEHLLIETTGVADPVPVISPFYRDQFLNELYEFTGTVCLVDCLNFSVLPEKEITMKQIAIADLILLNKSGKLTNHDKHIFLENISNLNPLSSLALTEFGDCANIDLEKITTKNIKTLPFPENSIHPNNLLSQALVFDRPFAREKFNEWLSYNLDLYKNKIYRVKGIINFEEEPYLFILQGVGGIFELIESDRLKDTLRSQIFIIGNQINIDLKKSF